MLGSSGKGGSMKDWLRVRVPGISYSLASHSSFFKEITWDHITIQLPRTTYLLGAKLALKFIFSHPPLTFCSKSSILGFPLSAFKKRPYGCNPRLVKWLSKMGSPRPGSRVSGPVLLGACLSATFQALGFE